MALSAGAVILGISIVVYFSRSTPAPPQQVSSPDTFDIQRAAPSVFTILCFDKDNNLVAQGSGFALRRDGLIATNWHVAESAYAMTATSGTGRTYKVDSLVNFDSSVDLALLQLANEDGSPITDIQPVRLADSRMVGAGQRVFTLSAPQGLSQSLSDGLISAVRSMDGHQFLQITAPVSHGSSGGPVFNPAGEVIGVIKGLIASGENLNFAIPIDSVVRLVNAPPPTPVTRAAVVTQKPERTEPTTSMFDQGYAAFQKKQYRRAAELFERASAADPKDSAAAYNAALSFLNLNELGRSTDYFQTFLKLSREDDAGVAVAKKWIAAYADSLTAGQSKDTASTEPARRSESGQDRVSPTHRDSAGSPNLEGLSPDQVRATLGAPSIVDNQTRWITWNYNTPQGLLRVFFVGGKSTLQQPAFLPNVPRYQFVGKAGRVAATQLEMQWTGTLVNTARLSVASPYAISYEMQGVARDGQLELTAPDGTRLYGQFDGMNFTGTLYVRGVLTQGIVVTLSLQSRY